jgi:hypothetical protein
VRVERCAIGAAVTADTLMHSLYVAGYNSKVQWLRKKMVAVQSTLSTAVQEENEEQEEENGYIETL